MRMTAWEIIRLILAALTPILVAALWKWVNSLYKHWKKGREAVAAAERAVLGIIKDEVTEIKKQFYNNGGLTIKDDMTEIKATLYDLKIGQRNTREILDVASFESDAQGRLIYVSAALCELIGATPDDLLDNSWIGRVHPADQDEVVKAWQRAVENASEFNTVHSFRKNDGMYQKVEPVVIHNKDKSGKVISSLGRLIPIGEPYKI